MSDCICMNPVFRYPGFDWIEIGGDETKGRFGEVSIHLCGTCGQNWKAWSGISMAAAISARRDRKAVGPFLWIYEDRDS